MEGIEDKYLKLEKEVLIDGRYVLEELLGSGSVAETWKVFDKLRQTPVVLKFLHPDMLRTDYAPVLNGLCRKNHEFAVKVYDWSEWHGRVFWVEEFISLTSGWDLIEGRSHFNEVDWRTWCEWLAGIVASLGPGEVHGGLHPGNLWVDDNFRPKVGDCGTYRLLGKESLCVTSIYRQTMSFLAPEVICGDETDQRTDQYSLAWLTYRFFSGDGSDTATPNLLGPGDLQKSAIPSQARPAVSKALNASLSSRHDSHDAFLKCLERGRTQDSDSGLFAGARHSTIRMIILPSIAVAAILLGFLVYSYQDRVKGEELLEDFAKNRDELIQTINGVLATNRYIIQNEALWGPAWAIRGKKNYESAIEELNSGVIKLKSHPPVKSARALEERTNYLNQLEMRVEAFLQVFGPAIQAARKAYVIQHKISDLKKVPEEYNTWWRSYFESYIHHIESPKRIDFDVSAHEERLDNLSNNLGETTDFSLVLAQLSSMENELDKKVGDHFEKLQCREQKSRLLWDQYFTQHDLEILPEPNVFSREKWEKSVSQYRNGQWKDAFLEFFRQIGFHEKVKAELDPLLSNAADDSTGQPDFIENSIGMRFRKVGDVYFSIWETRIIDYYIFMKNSGIDPNWQWTDAIISLDQGPTHPVTFVDLNCARYFSRWLTEFERSRGAIGTDMEYRLPTDREWSVAVGIPGEEPGDYPFQRQGHHPDLYPWGNGEKHKHSGNYFSMSRSEKSNFTNQKDSYNLTSPAGSFPPNKYGLYDMGGNVWERVSDPYFHSYPRLAYVTYNGIFNEEGRNSTLRGGSWLTISMEKMRSDARHHDPGIAQDAGFRVVLAPIMDSSVEKETD